MTGQPWQNIESSEQDVRLVVCDMDGTLLDGDGCIPDEFWSLLKVMNDLGIVFAPASGRQYATLAEMFSGAAAISTFVAENGSLVVSDGEVVDTTTLDRETYLQALEIIRGIDYRNAGVVVGGAKSAYAERTDSQFVTEIRTYNRALKVVDDLTDIDDVVLKMAIYDFDKTSQRVEEELKVLSGQSQIVVSGEYWIDIMSKNANKGKAVQALQKSIGVTPAQTVVFGDYLNDLEMLDRAELSFAMENAHPEVRSRARYLAPPNTEHGVLTVLKTLLS